MKLEVCLKRHLLQVVMDRVGRDLLELFAEGIRLILFLVLHCHRLLSAHCLLSRDLPHDDGALVLFYDHVLNLIHQVGARHPHELARLSTLEE